MCIRDRAYRLYGKAVIAGQNPVALSGYEEPQPDIALLRWRDDYYRTAHPHAEDVLLIIEISDSTLRYDRDVKVPLYAKNGIPEVWLLDIKNRQLEIYREPVSYTHLRHDSASCQGLWRNSPTPLTFNLWLLTSIIHAPRHRYCWPA